MVNLLTMLLFFPWTLQDLLLKTCANLAFFVWTHELLPLDILLLALTDRDDDPHALRIVVCISYNLAFLQTFFIKIVVVFVWIIIFSSSDGKFYCEKYFLGWKKWGYNQTCRTRIMIVFCPFCFILILLCFI